MAGVCESASIFSTIRAYVDISSGSISFPIDPLSHSSGQPSLCGNDVSGRNSEDFQSTGIIVSQYFIKYQKAHLHDYMLLRQAQPDNLVLLAPEALGSPGAPASPASPDMYHHIAPL
jgi:hypothetical protein